jgi:hypothetical protein
VVPQGAQSHLSSFAHDANKGWTTQIERASSEVRRFVRAGAGVVQKQEQRVVALPLPPPAVGSRQQGVDFRFLQIGHRRVVDSPQGHGLELARAFH